MLEVAYRELQGGQAGIELQPPATQVWGPGNIDPDPVFADAGNDAARASVVADADDDRAH